MIKNLIRWEVTVRMPGTTDTVERVFDPGQSEELTRYLKEMNEFFPECSVKVHHVYED